MSESNGSQKTPAKTAARNVSGLAHDMVTLAQLQAQLAKAELHDLKNSLVAPIVLLAVAAAFALGAVPVLLAGLAEALIELADLSAYQSLLIAAGVGMALAAMAGWLGMRKLRRRSGLMHRSQEELARNINWIKHVLSDPPAKPAPESWRYVSGGGSRQPAQR